MKPMNNDLLKARLNLHAVLRNLEDLPALDARAAEMIRAWRMAVCFSVHGGPAATLEFSDGRCRHYAACPPHPDVKLFFLSPAHLNAMFAGASSPLPLKGLSKLGFLKHEFAELTRRLQYFLRPEPELVGRREIRERLSKALGAAFKVIVQLGLLSTELLLEYRVEHHGGRAGVFHLLDAVYFLRQRRGGWNQGSAKFQSEIGGL